MTIINITEPSPVGTHNPGGGSALLIICEHASNRIPQTLKQLGLGLNEIQRHIAWDIGALSVAKNAADQLDATVIYQNYSRLVIDCNRCLSNSGFIAA